MDGYTISKALLSQEEQHNIYRGLQILQATNSQCRNDLTQNGGYFQKCPGADWLEMIFHFGGVTNSKGGHKRFAVCHYQ